MEPDGFDLDATSEEFRRGWEARGVHIPPLSTWRGTCGHLWDRALEDTPICARCDPRLALNIERRRFRALEKKHLALGEAYVECQRRLIAFGDEVGAARSSSKVETGVEK